jgi:hypothetical protein
MAPNDNRDDGERGLSLAARRLLAILAYYAIAVVAIVLLWQFWPPLRALLSGTTLDDLAGRAGDALTRLSDAGPSGGGRTGAALGQATATLLVLVGALGTSIPVAWVYGLTRRRKGFDQSMVHVMILLPIAVAGMVLLIQNSLALAFSLAGIVAVLRFRNTLDDVKDGVAIFIAVTIGISAGVGALSIGLVTSTVFNVSALLLWWLDFARRPTPGIRGGWRRFARLPKVPRASVAPPREPVPGRRDGDEVFASAARAWRRQLQITAEQRIMAPDGGRFNSTLRIHTAAPDVARPAVEELLRTRVKRWELVGIVPGEGGTFTMKYQLRLRRAARGELLDAVRTAPQTIGVELR